MNAVVKEYLKITVFEVLKTFGYFFAFAIICQILRLVLNFKILSNSTFDFSDGVLSVQVILILLFCTKSIHTLRIDFLRKDEDFLLHFSTSVYDFLYTKMKFNIILAIVITGLSIILQFIMSQSSEEFVKSNLSSTALIINSWIFMYSFIILSNNRFFTAAKNNAKFLNFVKVFILLGVIFCTFVLNFNIASMLFLLFIHNGGYVTSFLYQYTNNKLKLFRVVQLIIVMVGLCLTIFSYFFVSPKENDWINGFGQSIIFNKTKPVQSKFELAQVTTIEQWFDWFAYSTDSISDEDFILSFEKLESICPYQKLNYIGILCRTKSLHEPKTITLKHMPSENLLFKSKSKYNHMIGFYAYLNRKQRLSNSEKNVSNNNENTDGSLIPLKLYPSVFEDLYNHINDIYKSDKNLKFKIVFLPE